MWLWLICLFQLSFADEALRIAVLEFQTVQKMDPNFMFQLSDETRGGALDVFPPSTSKVSVLTRENLMDVLTQQGKDASCLEGNCAVGIGRNIGARFVVVGSVAQVEGVYRLTLGVYDSDSNDLLGQKSIQEASQVKLLGKVRPFAEGLIEQTLGGFDEGRLGVRKIGGLDTWAVSGSTQGILEIVDPRLKEARISINGRKVCDMRDKSICRALVEQGDVTVSLRRQYCDVFNETVSVGKINTFEPALVCRFAVLEPEAEWVSTKLDGKFITDFMDIEFGTYTLEVETPCKRSKVSIVVDERGIQHVPIWKEKTRTLKITYLNDDNQSVSVPVLLDGVRVGKTPFEQDVSVCSKQVEVRGDREEQIDLTELDDWIVEVLKVAPVPKNIVPVLKSGTEMTRLIPAGTFTMGCTSAQGSGCYADERPAHQVTISKSFYMMESEVTQGLYQQVMGNNPSYFRNENLATVTKSESRSALRQKRLGNEAPMLRLEQLSKNRPVENIDWFDAVEFANALSRLVGLEQCYTINGDNVSWSNPNCRGWRLPTEAEWEYAARGGESFKYAGSIRTRDVAWYDGNSNHQTHDVCGKESNGYGLCDMSGNVWEWVWDWYGSDYYSDSPTVDPQGPSKGSHHVRRGGSWYNGARLVRVSNRYNDPTYSSSGLGFRLCRTP